MRKTLLTLAALLLAAGTLVFAAGEGEGAASGDVPTLTMFGGLHAAIETLDSPENEYTVYMEEKFGVNIEWVAVPSQELKEKQNLLLASGDYRRSSGRAISTTPSRCVMAVRGSCNRSTI